MVLTLMRLPQPNISPRANANDNDRRSQDRYTVRLQLDCKVTGSEEIIAGETIDITTSGLRFRTDRTSPIGATVELRIKWPTPLPETIRLELVMEGRVVRSQGLETAIHTT